MPVNRRTVQKTATSAFTHGEGMPASLCPRLGNHTMECLPIIKVYAFSEILNDKSDQSNEAKCLYSVSEMGQK